MVDFKDASGCMSPLVTCKGHPAHRRQTFGICETNDEGEVRGHWSFFIPSTHTYPAQSALQVYCTKYKQSHIDNTHGLLRKAQRLDATLHTEDSIESESTQSSPDPQCSRCHTEFSPLFYPTPPSTPPGDGTPSSTSHSWLCHRCKFENDQQHGVEAIRTRLAVNGINGVKGVNGIVS